MTATLVSGIMPAYDMERFIGEAIESALAQDHEAFELIVVDDGSSDRTVEIVRSFPGVRLVEHDRNRGRAAACNTAVAASRGRYVTAFDADDLWPPNRVSLQAAFLDANPDVGCVLGRQEWLNPPPWLGRDAVFGDLDGIPIGSAMFRREVLDALGGYDPTFKHSEDMDLLIRVRERGIAFSILPEIVWYRRFHDGQMTANAPTSPPILRSLREKLERQRAAGE